jgi:hypothetical protein
VALPDRTGSSNAPGRLSDGFAGRVLSELGNAQQQRSQREARRLAIALMLIGAGVGLVLIAAMPFRGPGVGTGTLISWLARTLVIIDTLAQQEEGLLSRLNVEELPLGATMLVLACCLGALWRLRHVQRTPSHRLRRRTFLGLFALTLVALALALLTPLRAWNSGALHWGATSLTDPTAGATLALLGPTTITQGLQGGLTVIGGDAIVNGAVSGDVVVVLGNVRLEQGAVINGEAVAVGGLVYRSSGSVVTGDVVGSAPLLNTPVHSAAARVRVFLAVWVGLLFLGTSLATLFPWPMLLVAATARRFSWQSFVTAAGAAIGVLLVIVPLALSVAGLPVALALLMVTLLGWSFGVVAIGMAVGRRILRPLGLGSSTTLAAVLGLGVLGALAAIPIVGPLLFLSAGLLGAGATVISVLDTDIAAAAAIAPHVPSGERSA